MSKYIKYFLGFTLYFVVVVNVLILLSGKVYIYKGVYKTYLKGRKGPFLYDFKEGPVKIISKGSGIKEKEFSNKRTGLNSVQKHFLDSNQSTSLLVYKGSELIYNWYQKGHNSSTLTNSFSMSKSVVSFLIGIAIKEGEIKSVKDPICSYLPAFKKYGRSKITIEHLLTMSSGLDWNESGSDPLSENAEAYYGNDVNTLVLHQRVERNPGKLFNYQSGNTQLLAMILKQATGKDISTYAHEKLWSKLKPRSSVYWSMDKPKGHERAFCCIYASSPDFSLLGHLILKNGRVNNEQIIPLDFMNRAFNPAKLISKNGLRNERYGYHVWMYNGSNVECKYLLGFKGQYVIVLPKDDLVIVRTGHLRSKEYGVSDFFKDYSKGNSLENLQKIGHPIDLFEYIKLGKTLAKQ